MNDSLKLKFFDFSIGSSSTIHYGQNIYSQHQQNNLDFLNVPEKPAKCHPKIERDEGNFFFL